MRGDDNNMRSSSSPSLPHTPRGLSLDSVMGMGMGMDGEMPDTSTTSSGLDIGPRMDSSGLRLGMEMGMGTQSPAPDMGMGMGLLLRFCSSRFWQPDSSSRICSRCSRQFRVFRRRHHCRWCGRLFCSSCTAYRLHHHRVCHDCFHRCATWIHADHIHASIPPNPHHLSSTAISTHQNQQEGIIHV